MLNLKSSVKEINHYINQIKSLALSEPEKILINKILKLEEIISDSEISSIIENDLKDKYWLNETKHLIEICQSRRDKTSKINRHISDCINFLIYRTLETKLINCEYLVYELETGLVLDNNVKWNNQCFYDNLPASKFIGFFTKNSSEGICKFDLTILQKNRNYFFSNKLFN